VNFSDAAARRPPVVTVIAALHGCVAAGLWIQALLKLFAPDAISVTVGARFLFGLELAGPYMWLLVGCAWALVAWGLLLLHNWARWAAMGGSVLGVAGLVPRISAAPIGFPLLWYGLQIAIYAAVGWYLAQSPAVLDAFHDKKSE